MKCSRLRIVFISFLLVFIHACSTETYIGTQRQSTLTRPKRLVVLQIAGLTEELLAQARITWAQEVAVMKPLTLESSICLGQLWQDDFYSLRPDIGPQLNMQITANKNQLTWGKGKDQELACQLLEQKPFWSYLEGQVRLTYVQAMSVPGIGASLWPYAQQCQGAKTNSSARWPMMPLASAVNFAPQGDYSGPLERKNFDALTAEVTHPAWQGALRQPRPSVVYEAPNCDIKRPECLVSWWPKALLFWKKIHESSSENVLGMDVFYLRDTSLLGLTSTEWQLKHLRGLEDFLRQLRQVTQESSSTMVLVLGVPVAPAQVTRLWAWGARAQHFCGVYHSSELMQRLFFRE